MLRLKKMGGLGYRGPGILGFVSGEGHTNERVAHLGRTLPDDYDSDPARFAANQAANRLYSQRGDIHPAVAKRMAMEGCALVLDVGGGNGVLARELAQYQVRPVTADRAVYVRDAPTPALRSDALTLPFRDGTFSGAAMLWMLYHLPDPASALAEVRRVLRPGGLLAVCAPSRNNDPELAGVLPHWGEALSFDAENGPATVASIFGAVELETWDEPMVSVPDEGALALTLRGRGLEEHQAQLASERLLTPMTLTKRGMLAWARK
jgi:SAM-dependent methyltransferase